MDTHHFGKMQIVGVHNTPHNSHNGIGDGDNTASFPHARGDGPITEFKLEMLFENEGSMPAP